MSDSNISEALAIGWFLAASQFQSNRPLFYLFLTLGFMCLVAAVIIAIQS